VNTGTDSHNGTALMAAAYGGHTEGVRLLLDQGADINAKDRFGDTALKRAEELGNRKTAEILRAGGAKE
jgi:uncharacterized protein